MKDTEKERKYPPKKSLDNNFVATYPVNIFSSSVCKFTTIIEYRIRCTQTRKGKINGHSVLVVQLFFFYLNQTEDKLSACMFSVIFTCTNNISYFI